ncbi:sperm-tail PG-rich repeat-containing protein 2-like [Convolutriloba macropyga]|uniref:sperm-tail PG-rich repeat-containing protein 2-like n=1 Tax=Convolutriloba macropyga TaxID=536237 RepID=UPI003F51DB4C
MYDRAPRIVSQVKPTTTEIVGPGAYEVPIPADISRRKYDGYAPFGSLAPRNNSFLPSENTVLLAPGPGSYNLDKTSLLKGTGTLNSLTKRFGSSHKEVPGPSEYNVNGFNSIGSGLDATGGQATMSRSHTMPEARKTKLVVARKPDAPSIPAQAQAYGYEETEEGVLRRQEPPPKDSSMGPAFYQKNIPSTFNQRTANFGGYAGRKVEKPKLGPGPGEYDPHNPEVYVVENVNAKYLESRRPESHVPRFTESIQKAEEKRGVPDPGKYEVKSMFEKRPPVVNTEGIEVEQPPFMTQERRFKDSKTIEPGPGSYNDPRNAMEATKRITGLKRSPFGQTALRFSKSASEAPPPNSYNIVGLGEQNLRKAYLESMRRGAFGGTEVRNTTHVPKSKYNTPGPAHYQVSAGVGASGSKDDSAPELAKKSSMFVSNTKRLHEPPPIQTEVAPPAAYNVAKSFDKTQLKQTHHNPRSDSAKKRAGAFKVSSERFKGPLEARFLTADVENPGPGTYTSDKITNKAKLSLIVARDKRFKDEKERAPGPGAYEFSPLYADTLLRGTFNATLNNPVNKKYEDHGLLAGGNQAFLLGI